MVVTLGQGVLAGAGILDQTMLASILPTPEKLAASLEPAGSVTWTDAEGFHFKALSPFPGAQLLAAPEGLARHPLRARRLRRGRRIASGISADQAAANRRAVHGQHANDRHRSHPIRHCPSEELSPGSGNPRDNPGHRAHRIHLPRVWEFPSTRLASLDPRSGSRLDQQPLRL